MSILFYNILLSLYYAGIRLYAFFNAKARKWTDGRKRWEQRLKATLRPGEKRIWIHCSSLGEFEQGRPLIETLKEKYPGYKIVLTFFSPSGYEVRKDYDKADYVFYVPMDRYNNARTFIEAVNPTLAIFVKYEFWYYYLTELHKQNIPVALISAAFRKEQSFFKWYGSFFRKMLSCFSAIFVQDERSKELLSSIGLDKNVWVSGDTRYDRVAAIAQNIHPIPAVESFKAGKHFIIAGSTWPGDENILQQCLPSIPPGWKLIIAPHEIDAPHVQKIQEQFGNDTVLFSQLNENNNSKRILIIDNIGMLSALYAYGDIAFIGGGFQKGGIHNILEPAVFGLPVIFGPVYQKFVEANELVAAQLAFPVHNAIECDRVLQKLISDIAYRNNLHNSLIQFMQQHTGATQKITDWIITKI